MKFFDIAAGVSAVFAGIASFGFFYGIAIRMLAAAAVSLDLPCAVAAARIAAAACALPWAGVVVFAFVKIIRHARKKDRLGILRPPKTQPAAGRRPPRDADETRRRRTRPNAETRTSRGRSTPRA